jgi:ADP-ribose pyrophosphatase
MRITSLEQLTAEKWLNLFAAGYEHAGQEGRWVFASRRKRPHQAQEVCDAVLIVPLLVAPGEPPRLVLEKEFRVPVGDYVYGLPAGLIEPGESLEDTVRREMAEETGMEVVRFKRVTPPLYSSSGMTDEAAAMAFVDVIAPAELKTSHEKSEDIEVLLLDFAAVCRLCDEPNVRIDAKAWTALYMYQQLGQLV